MTGEWEYPVPVSFSDLFVVLCHNSSLVKTEGVATIKEKRTILANYLCNNQRQNSTLLTLSKEYLDTWLVFVSVLEHNRTLYQSTRPFYCGWAVPSNKNQYVTGTVWRFETIMAGLLHATVKFNIAMEGKKLKKNHDQIILHLKEAYSTLRNVCLINILQWELRKETSLPFESTMTGCISLMEMCLLEIQEEYIRFEKQGLSTTQQFGQFLWISKVTDGILEELLCRKNDGTISDHPWIPIVQEYRLESIVGMYSIYVFANNVSQTTLSGLDITNKVRFVCECTLEIIKKYKTKNNQGALKRLRTKEVPSECMARINKLQVELEKICDTNTEILDSNYQKTWTLKTNAYLNLDPRNFIPIEWKKPYFRDTDRGMSFFHDRYYGLTKAQKNELVALLFYNTRGK